MTRQVAVFRGRAADAPMTHTARGDRHARRAGALRFGAVEPVFANGCYNHGLDRFTQRGRANVDRQWKHVGLVHNIE